MTPIELLRSASHPTILQPLIDQASLAWGRAADLVLGVVFADDQDSSSCIRAAYAALDDAPDALLNPEDLWNIILLVRLPRSVTPDSFLIRQIESDLTCSRKLVFLEGEQHPQIFAPLKFNFFASDPIQTENTIESALDREARGELRQSLQLLLSQRRPAESVKRLIQLLGADHP